MGDQNLFPIVSIRRWYYGMQPVKISNLAETSTPHHLNAKWLFLLKWSKTFINRCSTSIFFLKLYDIMISGYSIFQYLRSVKKCTFSIKFLKSFSGQRSSDLQSFRHHWRCDQFIVGNFFVQFIICGFVKQYQVIQLVTDFSLRPLLQQKQEWTILSNLL